MMKEILFHMHDGPRFEHTLESALAIARACGGHLHCLHALPTLSYLSFRGYQTIAAIEAKMKEIDDRQDALAAELERQLEHEDVTWSYEKVISDVVKTILSRASLADLVVISRGDPDMEQGLRDRMNYMGELVTRLRTPLYIAGDNEKVYDPTGPAIIAWDGSHEAANAVRSAIQLLKLSSDVTVVRVTEKKSEYFPNTRLLHYLANHGVEAELVEEPFTENWVSRVLILTAEMKDVSYVVAGGYGRSRLSEFMFGGTTRSLLQSCPRGLLLSH